MPPRQPAHRRSARASAAPLRWLLTDARMADHGVAAARRLPPGGSILVRSDALPGPQRRRLIRLMRAIARARGLTLWLAGNPATARRWGAQGVHLRGRSGRCAAQARALNLGTCAPVHNRRQAAQARRARIDVALVSPVWPTRSHAGAPVIGTGGFARLARRVAPARALGLGGMTARRWRLLRRQLGSLSAGWAGIDGWAASALSASPAASSAQRPAQSA